jgi:two-component system sensor histidine kinase AlgZ
MMASIKQNTSSNLIKLPDMRNLGVQLRVLLLANLMALAAAVLISVSPLHIGQQLLQIAAVLEPSLLAVMLLLFVLHGWLTRLPYRRGVLAVFIIVLLLVTGLQFGMGEFLQEFSVLALVRLWLFSAVITGTILAYFNLRSRALSPAVTEARLQALHARIRPHFLYNSINAVLSLIRTDPRRAEVALEDLAHLFRVLMADNRQLVPLQGEIELCQQYLALEKLRLGDRLRVAWYVDPDAANALVPPLLLQPLLENAVYHGIEPAEKGGEILIDIDRSGNEVRILLSNPLHRASQHQSGNKMAINNIRERLALHFDAEGQLRFRIADGQYQVRIDIPYRTKP